MTHDEAYDLLEQFSLGGLETGQREEVKAHLHSGCTVCRTRFAELLALSERLAAALPQVDPPSRLRGQIMSQARHSTGAESAQLSQRWIWIAMGAAAVIVLGVWNGRLRNENAKLTRELAAYEDATLLLGQPGMQFVDLEGVAPNAQAFGKVVVDPNRGTGIVYMYRLPKNPEGMVYQLWVMREGRPTSAGTFTVGEDGSAVLSLESLDHAAALASFQVTIEPEAGVAQPSGMLYLTGPDISPPTP